MDDLVFDPIVDDFSEALECVRDSRAGRVSGSDESECGSRRGNSAVGPGQGKMGSTYGGWKGSKCPW
jgi:hypothetical protein